MIGMLLLGALAGGVAAFVWGAISWMALPWHRATFASFRDQEAVARVIAENAPRSGLYGIPAESDADADARMKSGPLVLAVVQLRGFGSVGLAMLRAFVIYAAASLILSWLLLQAPLPGLLARATFVCLAALAGTVICRVTDWNWHGYPASYTIVSVADVAIGWFLTGLAIAAVVHR